MTNYEVNHYGQWYPVQRIAPDGIGSWQVQCVGFIVTISTNKLRIVGTPEPLLEPYQAAAKRYAEQKNLANI